MFDLGNQEIIKNIQIINFMIILQSEQLVILTIQKAKLKK